MVDFIREPCPHEKAFNELLQFLGNELSLAKTTGDIDQWARNLFCVYSHYIGLKGDYCNLWGYVVDSVSQCSPDPARPYTYHKIKAKIDELDARVRQQERELDAQENQT